MKLRLVIPKGSLETATVDVFKRAGFNIIIKKRSYSPFIDDENISVGLLRAQDIPRFVEERAFDCGITGSDWVRENNSKVVRVVDLVYAKQTLGSVRWVLAVPESSKIRYPKDLKGKRLATELVNVTKAYLRKNKVDAKVEFSWGATEAKVGSGIIDGIVELTETGRSLKEQNLRIIDTVYESTTRLIANKLSWKDKAIRKTIENLALLLKGAVSAEGKAGLKMNVSSDNLNKIISLLPAMKKPTVSSLFRSDWFDIETIIDEKVAKILIPKLKDAGAQGIVEYPLNKVIY
ncbi:MAG: ATP phosphoribosyltransferase [Candidatus Omnitrophota bacterium]|nr:ATP phosphoribosyltransferase [Candidatus Omnitrophota bacterium]